jgi:TPR repeat protein
MGIHYPCCGKSICKGCIQSFCKAGNDKCPFCNADRASKTEKECAEEIMKRVNANDAASIDLLGRHYQNGEKGFQQDHAKAMELYNRAAELGFSSAHSHLAGVYHQMGDLKKAKVHLEAGAMVGHEEARFNVGNFEVKSGNMDRAVKHWTIAASSGCYRSMHKLRLSFERGAVSRESMDSTLTAYNNSCAEMRSEARDAYIRIMTETD